MLHKKNLTAKRRKIQSHFENIGVLVNIKVLDLNNCTTNNVDNIANKCTRNNNNVYTILNHKNAIHQNLKTYKQKYTAR